MSRDDSPNAEVCQECQEPMDEPGYLHDECDTVEVLEA